MIKLKAAELRTTVPKEEELKKIKKNPIYIILDDVWDTYNVGAIFRLADAVSAEKVFLCGGTETPPNTRIKKASINTTEWVQWEYCESAVKAIRKLKVENGKLKINKKKNSQLSTLPSTPSSGPRGNSQLRVVAIEQSENSVPYDKVDYDFPIALVVGHETNGVSKEVLEIADQIVEIPMWGVNKSLNVMVSLGIVLYKAMEQNKINT